MKEQLEAIRAGALAAIGAAGNTGELESLRVQYLGKKGELTALLKQMGKLSAEERPAMGALANEVRAALEAAIEEASQKLEAKALEERLEDHWWTLNAMLSDCGMAPLDLRNPFDWLILYAICADESEYMSDRMEQVLAHLFPENQAL